MKNKGITLVALVITIILLLILAGISISALTGTGLFEKAQEAKEKTENAQKLENTILSEYEIELEKYSKEEKGIKITEIFDQTGEEEGKLHVGDFVNYTAGNWTQADLDKIANSGAKIAANNDSTALPTKAFQFGGFQVGNSKDGSAKAYNSSYDCVKDKNTEEAVTGWRIFDIEEDGTIILISAGCPEDYYFQGSEGYISEYILTGNINNNTNAEAIGAGTTYLKRDWSMYLNSRYKTKTATVVTKANLDSWYSKYKDIPNADIYSATFQTIYGTKYESLIDNYSYYWLGDDFSPNVKWIIDPYQCSVSGASANRNIAVGIRVLVSLSPETRISEESIGTKTIISRGTEYTYNIWGLQ